MQIRWRDGLLSAIVIIMKVSVDVDLPPVPPVCDTKFEIVRTRTEDQKSIFEALCED